MDINHQVLFNKGYLIISAGGCARHTHNTQIVGLQGRAGYPLKLLRQESYAMQPFNSFRSLLLIPCRPKINFDK